MIICKVGGNMEYISKTYETTMEAASFRPEQIEKMDTLLEGLVTDKKYIGASYLMSRNGSPFYAKAMGQVSFDESRGPLKIDTIHGLASITKIFTAVAIMQLIEAGKLYLDQPVSTIVREFDNDMYKAVTVFHLLTHTSGVAPDSGILGEPNPDHSIWEEKKDWIKNMVTGLPYAKPGERWAYSTSGFMLLGEIVAKVSGIDYDIYVQNNIIKPLKMNRTFFFIPEDLKSEVCTASAEHMEWLNEKREDLIPSRLAGGSLYSTLEDLAIFGQMLMDNGVYKGVRILARRTVEEMTKNQLGHGLPSYCWESTGQLMQYGLGLHTKAQNLLSRGSFCHEGAGRSGIYIDRKEQFMAVYFEPMLTEDWDYVGSLGLRNLMWAGLE